jgi:nucleotide-binding universal stress UspA family protein
VEREPSPEAANPDSPFAVVLVGIDDTPESLVAAVQADVLRVNGGSLHFVAVAERYLAAHAGLAARHASVRVAENVADDLARAQRLVEADDTILAEGRLVSVLRAEGEQRAASLLVVGARAHGKLRARTLGGHDEEALADAPCSVLLARPGWGPRRPNRVVHCPGSAREPRYAEAVARRLAERLGCELVIAVGVEDDLELESLAGHSPDVVVDPGSQVDAAATAATTQSLLVVDRDLGVEAVRRLAYGVSCSVLVVHRPATGATASASA